MKDPRQLSAKAETSELVQSLLAAGRARCEPEGARERVWAALAAGVAGGVAAMSATGATKASAGLALGKTATGAAQASAGAGAGGGSAKGAGFAFALTKAKLLAIGGVLTAAGVAATAVDRVDLTAPAEAIPAEPMAARSPAKPTVIATTPPTNVEAPRADPVSDDPVDVAAAAPSSEARAPLRVRTSAEVKGARASALGEEASLLRKMRSAMTRGDHEAARANLDEARARFPTSQLAPERDALEVRLESESGDRARAARLARAFVERYPQSPLRPSIEAIADAAEKD